MIFVSVLLLFLVSTMFVFHPIFKTFNTAAVHRCVSGLLTLGKAHMQRLGEGAAVAACELRFSVNVRSMVF